jgi:hypothetical protein
MQNQENNNTESQLRVVKTARTEQAINEAAEQGFRPLIKPVVPSPEIKVKFAIKQDKETGKITVANDFRQLDIPIKPVMPELLEFYKPDTSVVIGWTYYYPYQFESPFAAYLVPQDIKVGEKVMLEDLIEDVVSYSWNQGDTFRLKSCAAIWGGQDFVILHKPAKGSASIVG